jgi:hypothetical protein
MRNGDNPPAAYGNKPNPLKDAHPNCFAAVAGDYNIVTGLKASGLFNSFLDACSHKRLRKYGLLGRWQNYFSTQC